MHWYVRCHVSSTSDEICIIAPRIGVASRDKLELSRCYLPELLPVERYFFTTPTCTGNYTEAYQGQGSERINHDHAVVNVSSEGSCSAASDSVQTLPPPVPGLAGDTDVLGHAIRLHQAGDSEAAKDTYNALLEVNYLHVCCVAEIRLNSLRADKLLRTWTPCKRCREMYLPPMLFWCRCACDNMTSPFKHLLPSYKLSCVEHSLKEPRTTVRRLLT